MKTHLTDDQILRLISGKDVIAPSDQLLHLLNCSRCREKTAVSAPAGFIKEGLIFEGIRLAKLDLDKHFSDSEIQAYVRRETALKDRVKMHEHFSECGLCCGKLKDLDAGYIVRLAEDKRAYYTALQSETVSSDFGEPAVGFVERHSGFIEKLKSLFPVSALAAAGVALAATLSYFALLPDSGDRDVSGLQNAEIPFPVSDSAAHNPVNLSPSEQTQTSSISGDESGRGTVTGAEKKTSGRPPSKHSTDSEKPRKTAHEILPQNKVAGKLPVNSINQGNNTAKLPGGRKVADSRGNIADSSVEVAVLPKNNAVLDNQPVLQWKEVSSALNYNIYISDAESNNLIEQAKTESAKETSYKIKARLEKGKKYEWRVIADTSDGEVVGKPSYFVTSKNYSDASEDKKTPKQK